MEETITTQKQRKRGGSDEEMIDVREPANQLMQRIAKLHPSVYPSHLPHYRSDTIEYISSKSASTRRMVNDTERVRRTMKKARDELDILEREVSELQQMQWRNQARKKYFVPEKPADFVFYDSEKYSLKDFVPKSYK